MLSEAPAVVFAVEFPWIYPVDKVYSMVATNSDLYSKIGGGCGIV